MTNPALSSGRARESCGRPSREYTRSVSGTAAITEKPICNAIHQSQVPVTRPVPLLLGRLTSWPVQNMGHLFQGACLASLSHVLRYGFRTIKGSTGGVSNEAEDKHAENTAATAVVDNQCMV